jgi:hypothetical protein
MCFRFGFPAVDETGHVSVVKIRLAGESPGKSARDDKYFGGWDLGTVERVATKLTNDAWPTFWLTEPWPPPDGIKGDSLQLAALLSRVVPTFPTVPFRLPIWASGGLDAENSGFDQCLDMGDLVRKVDAFLKDRPARLLLLPQKLAERLHRRGAHVTMLDVLAPRFRDANFWQAYEKVIVGVRSHELPLLIDVLLDRYQPARQPQRQRPKPRPGPPGISSELIEPSRVAVHRTRSCGPLPPPRDVEHPDLPHIAREDPFVGRERDFWSIQRHFEGMTRHSGDNIRIAAIDGPSGVGKTRLAFEYVRRFAELFPGGIYWIWAEGMDAAEISASLEQQTPVSLACFSQPSAPREIRGSSASHDWQDGG